MDEIKITRISRSFTAQEREQWERDVVTAEAENTAEARERQMRMLAAADEPTFSGELRRAIHNVHRTCGFFLPTLLDRSGMTWEEMRPFLLGEGSLSTESVDRLTQVLGLHLQTVAVDSASTDDDH